MALTLVTVEDIRAFTGLTVAQIDDGALESIASRAEAFIKRKCNRTDGFVAIADATGTASSWTEYVEGFDANHIYVRNSPILSITSIKLVHSASSLTTIDSTLYTFETDYSGKISAYTVGPNRYVGAFETGQPLVETLCAARLFPRGYGRKNIQVVYVGGFEPIPPDDAGDDYVPVGALEIPGDLQQAVIELTYLWYQRRNRDPELQSETLGKYQYTRAATELDKQLGVPPGIGALISDYVRYAV